MGSYRYEARSRLEGRPAHTDVRARAADARGKAGAVAGDPPPSRRPSAGRWTSVLGPPGELRPFFPGEIPGDPEARRRYAREILGRFATKAFRRPWTRRRRIGSLRWPKRSVRTKGRPSRPAWPRAMTAVLTSPRFLFREEGCRAGLDRTGIPLVDEYALASRLSYFLWSSMPDDELIRLAGEHKLRANLPAQVERMLADPRSAEFFRHFVGQWLQARDIETVLINTFAVISRDEPPRPRGGAPADAVPGAEPQAAGKPVGHRRKKELQGLHGASFGAFRRFREFELTGDLRQAMRQETEMLFEHIVREDRSLLELLDSDYTFLNERLAKHYGIDGVKGDAMRRVDAARRGVRAAAC